jgi:nucleotide-binding universal stress UspA family protein
MRDLFVPLPGLRDDDVLVERVIGLAHAQHAFLSLWLPPPGLEIAPPCGSASATVLARLVERAELLAAERASALRERMRVAGVDGEVRVESVPLVNPAAAMAVRAGCADLAVIAGAPATDDAMAAHATFGALLSASGRPVLVTPPGSAAPLHRFGKLLLAWKPTRECARACFDALALLQPHTVVVVAIAGGEDEADSAAIVAAHLSRRGLDVDVATPRCTDSVAGTLLEQADAHGADAIVAGGYGHARLREWMLGGTTRELFSRLDRPVLFSH